MVVDDVTDDNADHDVVDMFTNGIVEEFNRVVEGGFSVFIIVEAEELALHEIVEEDDVEIEATDVLEVVEVSDEERIVIIGGVVEIIGGDEASTIVEEINILGDNGVLVVVDDGGVVNTAEEVLVGDVEHTDNVVGDSIVVVAVDEGVVALDNEDHKEIVESVQRDVVDISKLGDEVDLGGVELVLDIVVVANAIVEREDSGVDVASAVVDNNGVVDAVVRAVVQVAGIVRPVLVIGGVAVNVVEEYVDVVGPVDEVLDAIALVGDAEGKEVNVCDVVVMLGPMQEIDPVVATLVAARALVAAIALVVLISGADVDGDPHTGDVDVVEVRPVDVDVVVAPRPVQVGPAVVGGPDGHSIVEVYNAHVPGAVVEGCASSGVCAVVDMCVRLGVKEVVDACGDSGSEVA